jgi:hypothetical protein
LRGRVIDLENAKVRVRVAMSEGVEPCTEKDILLSALLDGASEVVFGVAAPCDKECAKGDGERTVRTGGRAMKLVRVRGSENWDSDGIVENKWRRIVDLVRSATQGYAKCSSRGNSRLHRSKCSGTSSEHTGTAFWQEDGCNEPLDRCTRA